MTPCGNTCSHIPPPQTLNTPFFSSVVLLANVRFSGGIFGPSSSGGRRTENGVSSTGRGELNRSFRQTGGLDGEGDEDDDGYDQEIDEDDEKEISLLGSII